MAEVVKCELQTPRDCRQLRPKRQLPTRWRHVSTEAFTRDSGPSQWRTRPVMLRVACGDRAGDQEGFNHPASAFAIETNQFAGKMYFRDRNCADEPKEYFSGKNRQLLLRCPGPVQALRLPCLSAIQA